MLRQNHKADGSSLRENIAVVPQDATLFSETIMTNLRYAKLTASKREVYEACKTAKIHDKIMSIPDSQFFFQTNTFVTHD
jgi:ABC-type multidrug transport system fused ATPase/permease subunit